MPATNDITQDKLISRVATQEYAKGHDAIDWSVKLNTDEPLCNECGEIECKCISK